MSQKSKLLRVCCTKCNQVFKYDKGQTNFESKKRYCPECKEPLVLKASPTGQTSPSLAADEVTINHPESPTRMAGPDVTPVNQSPAAPPHATLASLPAEETKFSKTLTTSPHSKTTSSSHATSTPGVKRRSSNQFFNWTTINSWLVMFVLALFIAIAIALFVRLSSIESQVATLNQRVALAAKPNQPQVSVGIVSPPEDTTEEIEGRHEVKGQPPTGPVDDDRSGDKVISGDESQPISLAGNGPFKRRPPNPDGENAKNEKQPQGPQAGTSPPLENDENGRDTTKQLPSKPSLFAPSHDKPVTLENEPDYRKDYYDAMATGQYILELPNPKTEMRFIYIPAGNYKIGCSPDQLAMLRAIFLDSGDPSAAGFAGHNAKPAIQIQLTRGFFILDHEITREQYSFYQNAKQKNQTESNSSSPENNSEKPNGRDVSEEDLPKTDVTWREANGYCKWLSNETNQDIRLPTEIEWEIAARGAGLRLYPWPGDVFQAWAEKQGDEPHPQPIGENTKDVSWRGVRNLGGNVSEWTLDKYARSLHNRLKESIDKSSLGSMESPYRFDPSDMKNNRFIIDALVVDPNDPRPARTYRGGSYKDTRGNCVVVGRRSLQETVSSPAIGFRPILALPQSLDYDGKMAE